MTDVQDHATRDLPTGASWAPSRIIVGIDGSPNAERALDFACAEAQLWGASLLLVHSWEVPYGGGMDPIPDVTPEITSAARSLLDRAAAHARDRCGTATDVATLLTRGNAAGTLLHQASDGSRSERTDLIVVGSRGRGGFTSLLLGSVCHQVVHHAAVAVAVVPMGDPDQETGRIRHVVVGVDGSAESLHAAKWAGTRAALGGNDLVLVNVVQVPRLINPWSLLTPPDAAERLAELGTTWCREAAAAVAEVAPTCVVHHRVVHGVVANELLAATGPADLLVVGAVGAGGAARAILGRVTQHVLHRANTPVVVVPGVASAAARGGSG